MIQSLPLNIKVARTKRRIEEWISYNSVENTYLSHSGGKDSTVAYHILKQVNKNVPSVFCNTGLEQVSVVKQVNKIEGLITIRPSMNINQVISKYGYPIISKDVSLKIHKLRKQNLDPKYRNYLLNGDERGSFGTIPKEWQYLINADFDISNFCCDKLKKQPFKMFEKKTGRIAKITGEIADESRDRKEQYLKFGCNAFNKKSGIKSTPLGFWLENDILQYIYENDIEIASVYGDIIIDYYKKLPSGEKLPQFKTTGESRTGCVACAFGLKYDCNRFLRLKEEHPSQYNYCINGGEYNKEGIWKPTKEGLGYSHILNYLGIPY